MSVNHGARLGGSIFFSMKVYCLFSLESPQQGDSNEYTQYTISQYKKEHHPKLSLICSYGIVSQGLKNEFVTTGVNKPSAFEPLKFYCKNYYKFPSICEDATVLSKSFTSEIK